MNIAPIFFHNVLSSSSITASSRTFHVLIYRLRHTFQDSAKHSGYRPFPSTQEGNHGDLLSGKAMQRKYPILGYFRKQMIFDFGIRIGY